MKEINPDEEEESAMDAALERNGEPCQRDMSTRESDEVQNKGNEPEIEPWVASHDNFLNYLTSRFPNVIRADSEEPETTQPDNPDIERD